MTFSQKQNNPLPWHFFHNELIQFSRQAVNGLFLQKKSAALNSKVKIIPC
jgi:hypothetical protein